MTLITVLYFIIVLVTVITSYGNTGLSVTISGLVAPILSWVGGTWMRGSFYSNKKILGLAIGLVSLGISAAWISYTGFHVTIYDISVEGELWVFIGFVIGYFVTKREDVY